MFIVMKFGGHGDRERSRPAAVCGVAIPRLDFFWKAWRK